MRYSNSFTLATFVVLSLSLMMKVEGTIRGFSATTPVGSSISVPSGSWFFNNWKTTTTTGIPSTYYNDGNFFSAYGLYKIPVTGVYQFAADLFFEVTGSTAPNQNIDLRFVTCSDLTCSPSPSHLGTCASATSLSQQANTWLNDLPAGGATPAYNPTVTFSGHFTAGQYVGLCIENWSSVSFPLLFPEVGISRFSGYLVPGQ